MKKLVYPAILYPFEVGEGYTVEVPDLTGCISQGYSLADAIEMAIDAASGWILDELEDDWEVIEYSSTQIRLKDVSGGNGGTDYLYLSKN